MLCTGTLIIPLIPQQDEEDFRNKYGFSSKEIPDLIDYSNDTGRIQFVLESHPIAFKNLPFLEPLFRELNPPVLLGRRYDKKRTEYAIEIETIIKLYENEFFEMWSELYKTRSLNENLVNEGIFIDTYADLKMLGFNDIADEIFNNTLIDPFYSEALVSVSDSFITGPMLDQFHPLYSVNYEKAIAAKRLLGEKMNYKRTSLFPFEIGSFLLKEKSFSPSNIEDCKLAIEIYDNNEFYKVYRAFSESISDKNYLKIDANKKNLIEIFEQVWEEADTIEKISSQIQRPIDFFIAGIGLAIGELTTRGIIGADMGFLAGLGYLGTIALAGDFIRNEVPLNFSKKISKPYNVTIFNFKQP